MNLIDKLRAIMDSLADDGSRERAREWERIIKDADEMRELLANPTFQKLIGGVQGQLKARLLKLIDEDPELRALMNLLISTIGLQETSKRIEKSVDQLLEGAE
jgi:hypothetical protein